MINFTIFFNFKGQILVLSYPSFKKFMTFMIKVRSAWKEKIKKIWSFIYNKQPSDFSSPWIFFFWIDVLMNQIVDICIQIFLTMYSHKFLEPFTYMLYISLNPRHGKQVKKDSIWSLNLLEYYYQQSMTFLHCIQIYFQEWIYRIFDLWF